MDAEPSTDSQSLAGRFITRASPPLRIMGDYLEHWPSMRNALYRAADYTIDKGVVPPTPPPPPTAKQLREQTIDTVQERLQHKDSLEDEIAETGERLQRGMAVVGPAIASTMYLAHAGHLQDAELRLDVLNHLAEALDSLLVLPEGASPTVAAPERLLPYWRVGEPPLSPSPASQSYPQSSIYPR